MGWGHDKDNGTQEEPLDIDVSRGRYLWLSLKGKAQGRKFLVGASALGNYREFREAMGPISLTSLSCKLSADLGCTLDPKFHETNNSFTILPMLSN